MERLNYHHLLYFWLAAREGSITRAADELRLGQPTVSAQIRTLEDALGEKLFTRIGRRLALSETGRLVFRYADEIFALGHELTEALQHRPAQRPIRFTVGLADVLPKLLAYRFLEPALRLPNPIRLLCVEDKPERLLARLAVHEIDLVLADAPVGPTVRIRAFNHLLGECGVTFFATAQMAKRYRRRFPRSLDGAPVLLPTEDASLRRSLDQWFNTEGINPIVVSESDDSALTKAFGQVGLGVFAMPSVIAVEIKRQYGVHVIGHAKHVRTRFYAISVERRLKHPAVVAISEAARQKLFV